MRRRLPGRPRDRAEDAQTGRSPASHALDGAATAARPVPAPRPRAARARALAAAAWPPALVVVLLLGGWEAYSRWADVSPTVLPPPSSVAQATWDDWDTLRVDTWVTLQETGLGLLLALAVALLVGVAIDRFAWARRGVYPLCVTLQTIPIVAIAPLMVIWFGIGLLPKVLLIALSAFFPIAVGLVQGLASTDEDAMNLLRTMRATRLQLLLRVRLPSALPQLFTGLKITVTYAVVAAVLAEVVGAFDGLGRYMQESRNAFRTDLVIGAAAVTTLLTLALFGLVLLVERLLMPWYRPARGHRRW